MVTTSSYVVRETPSGSVNGSNVTFILVYTPVSNSEMVFLNGVLQNPARDYSINGRTITFVNAPNSNEPVRVTYLK